MSASTELFKLIKAKKWDAVMTRVALFPEEASKPATQNFSCGTSTRCLPIHAAVMRNIPRHVLLALTSANPDTVRTKDSLGRLPLHYATRFGASVQITEVLLSLFPQGAAVTSVDGTLPLMLSFLYGNSIPVVKALIDAYPDAIEKRCDAGLSCFEYASDNPKPIRQTFLTLILETTNSQRERASATCSTTMITSSGLSLQPMFSNQSVSTTVPMLSTKTSSEPTNSEATNNAPSCPKSSKRRSSTKLCVVCMEKAVTQVLVPCGHTCLCEDCGNLQGLMRIELKCPECRTDVEQAVKFWGRVVND